MADLVSMPTARSKGYGYHLFSYLEETAKKAGCARCAASLVLWTKPLHAAVQGRHPTYLQVTFFMYSLMDPCMHAGSSSRATLSVSGLTSSMSIRGSPKQPTASQRICEYRASFCVEAWATCHSGADCLVRLCNIRLCNMLSSCTPISSHWPYYLKSTGLLLSFDLTASNELSQHDAAASVPF